MKVITKQRQPSLSRSQITCDYDLLPERKGERVECFVRTKFEQRQEGTDGAIKNSLRFSLLLAWSPKRPRAESKNEDDDCVIEFEEYLLPEFLPKGAVDLNLLLNGEGADLLYNLEDAITGLILPSVEVAFESGLEDVVVSVQIGRYTASSRLPYDRAEAFFALPKYEKALG